MKTWQSVLVTVIVMLLIGSVALNIFQIKKSISSPTKSSEANTFAPPLTQPEKSSEILERAAYILAYYDARISSLNKDLRFKGSYFNPVDLSSIDENSSARLRYLLWKYQKQGYLTENDEGAAAGKYTGDSIATWVKEFTVKLESFRSYASNCAICSKEEARQFYVDMELWCKTSQENADEILSFVDFYDVVWDSSWCCQIRTALEELLKVQNEMLAICEEIYEVK